LFDESHTRRYHADGFAAPIPVLTPQEVAAYRSACDALEAALGGKPRTVQVRQMHLHLRWAFDLAAHPHILDAVESVLGPDLFVWATELFAKHPRDPAVAIGWHRDAPYLGLAAGRHTTAWIALTDSTPENGCMRVLPRTAERSDPDRDGDKPTPAEEPDLVDVALRAGEMSLHAGDVIHGSSPNVSDHKRVGFVVRYLAPDARPASGRPPVVRVRGSARAEYWAVVERPVETDPGEALARMRASAAAHFDLVLGNLKRAKGQAVSGG
jgi:ectoine hydroxylase-related dioxygenase (phytanoyl-CoA dioxygenase family)